MFCTVFTIGFMQMKEVEFGNNCIVYCTDLLLVVVVVVNSFPICINGFKRGYTHNHTGIGKM